jgi:hypothetical protein
MHTLTGPQLLISIIGVVIAWLLYRLNVQQQRDTWLRTFKDMHEAFWNDADMAEVRAWLACQAAYLEIEPILAKRKRIEDGKDDPRNLSKEEYATLEKLDKFFNFMQRTLAIIERVKVARHRDLWHQFYVQYWLNVLRREDRTLLQWYVKKFYNLTVGKLITPSEHGRESGVRE